MYFLKIQGTGKIPDYIQVRDDDFTLIAYFRADRAEMGIRSFNLLNDLKKLLGFIQNLPYGKIEKFII